MKKIISIISILISFSSIANECSSDSVKNNMLHQTSVLRDIASALVSTPKIIKVKRNKYLKLNCQLTVSDLVNNSTVQIPVKEFVSNEETSQADASFPMFGAYRPVYSNLSNGIFIGSTSTSFSRSRRSFMGKDKVKANVSVQLFISESIPKRVMESQLESLNEIERLGSSSEKIILDLENNEFQNDNIIVKLACDKEFPVPLHLKH